MVRKILFCFLLVSLVFQALPQEKRRGKVKRKYREENVGRQDLPQVFVHGRVWNLERKPLPGASVTVPGTWINVHTNENGEYYLKGLPTGRVSICVSYVGYRTKIIDYYLQAGNNDVLFTLDLESVAIEPLPVVSQLREQHMPDVPQSVSMISRSFMEGHTIEDMTRLADFVPGFQLREESPHQLDLVIRGISNDLSGSAEPSRIAVFYDQVPVGHPAAASFAMYDMDRIEILRGPQNTLFGSGAAAGVVRFLPQKPETDFSGFLTAGAGDFGMKDVRGAVNLPVIRDKLFFRTAGIYTYRDGYVSNTFGGTLNGRNTLGGRMSVRILPFWNTQVDFLVNYQKDAYPGTAYMSRDLPNSQGITDIFRYEASLEQGKNLQNSGEMLLASMQIKLFRNASNYLFTNTSRTSTHADSRSDGDGTAAPSLDLTETIHAEQFSQEVRYHFSKKSRLNGSIGANYKQASTERLSRFGTDEQYLAYLFLQMPRSMVNSEGKPQPMASWPVVQEPAELAGIPLYAGHVEENQGNSDQMTVDLFLDATWQLSRRISFTYGIRGFYERFSLTNASAVTSGDSSLLGMVTGKNPGVFLKPVEETAESGKWKGVTYRADLKFELYENTVWYAGYARGRRPPVIRFDPDGNSTVLERELLNSFETGLKTSVKNRLWLDVTGFFHLSGDFHSTGRENYSDLVYDKGKATAFGIETSFKAAVVRNITLFGNYAWIHSRFDLLDMDGSPQEYAGHEMKGTPAHSFAAGIDGCLKLTPWLQVFASPSYAWKSHFWFDDANTPGLEQVAYGNLDATAGFEFPRLGVTVSFTGTNLLEEKYLVSAGHPGALYGIPTFIPGPPRMLSGRLTWEF